MKISRVLAGVLLGAAVVGFLWYGGWVLPPERLSRAVAAYAAVFPRSIGEAEVQRLECPPLKRLRIYGVCTRDCTEVRRVVVVKGLQASTVANYLRIPPDDEMTTRRRMNALIGREALRLDESRARQMVEFFLRLDGLALARILPEGGLEAVAGARFEGPPAMQRLAAELDRPGAQERIPIARTAEGFDSEFLYWDTDREDQPVDRILLKIAPDGQLRSVHVVQLPAGGAGAAEAVP